MRASFVRVDVVHEGKRVVVVAVVILDRAFDDDAFSRGLERDRLGVQGLAVAEQVLHELGEAALVEERLLFLLSLALVLERDRELAFLNKALTITLKDVRKGQQKEETFFYSARPPL